MRSRNLNRLAALVGAVLCLGTPPAQAGVVLSENFDSGTAAYTATVPAGHPNAVHIRPAGDPLHTSNNNGFNGYSGFTGSYLVLGDNAAALASPLADGPVGPTGNATSQTSKAAFSLGLFGAGSHSLFVSFDYAFDTTLAPTNGPSPDDFFVRLMVGTTLVDELLFFGDVQRNDATRKGKFSDTVHFTLAAPGSVSIEFGLTEFANAGDSAVGIDNLQVVPEPGSLTLVALTLAGLSLRGRRRASAC